MDLLERTLPYHPALDVVRFFGMFLGAAVLGYAVKDAVVWHRQRHLHVAVMALLVCLGATGLLVALQELEQLGDPMIWWRFPLLLFIAVNGVIGLRALPRRLQPGG